MGHFPIRSNSGNLYLMLSHHCNFTVILVKPFRSKHDRHRLAAYTNNRRRI